MTDRLLKLNVGFIGFGRMGVALAKGALDAGILSRRQICAFDCAAAGKNNAKTLRVRVCPDLGFLLARTQLIFLCVKPQQMKELMMPLKWSISQIRSKKGIVSIAAGVPLAWLEKELGPGASVIRVMPNTPALVGEGMSVMSIGKNASKIQAKIVHELLGAVGQVLILPERQLDMVTAVSGSGPAYVFYLAESLIRAGVAGGLSETEASLLVKQTILGAGKMLGCLSQSPAELRQQVTSPGGTTEAAIQILEKAKLHTSVVQAVQKAKERSRELSRLLSKK